MDLQLKDKHALVCGSTQGIGKAIAMVLAEEGAKITLLARNETQLQKIKNELPGFGHKCIVADFSDPSTLVNLTGELKTLGIDILINNAGGPPPGQLIESDWQAMESALTMHLRTSHLLTASLVPGMKSKGFGRIVNIISTSVRIPIAGLGVSNTVRGAMASWAKTLSNELGSFGITVNSLLPGFMETSRLEAIVKNEMEKTGNSREEVVRIMTGTVPVRRFGQPREMADLAAYICSPLAGYITGQAICVDGGRTGSI